MYCIVEQRLEDLDLQGNSDGFTAEHLRINAEEKTQRYKLSIFLNLIIS